MGWPRPTDRAAAFTQRRTLAQALQADNARSTSSAREAAPPEPRAEPLPRWSASGSAAAAARVPAAPPRPAAAASALSGSVWKCLRHATCCSNVLSSSPEPWSLCPTSL